MDTLLLIIGGVVMACIGFGFYKFIQYMKKNRKQVNQEIKDFTNRNLFKEAEEKIKEKLGK
jgi:hypothetical protein